MNKNKIGRIKRIFAASLALALIAGALPATPLAQYTDFSVVASAAAEPTGEAYSKLTESKTENLENKTFYKKLKTFVDEVVSGDSTSTIYSLTGSNELTYNVNGDLHFDNYSHFQTVMNSSDDSLSDADKALKKQTLEKFITDYYHCDVDAVMDALLADCPLEMCWFDKTMGYSSQMQYSYSYSGNDITLQKGATLQIVMHASADYAVTSGSSYDPTQVDPTEIARIASAKTAAENIVAKYASQTDYNKLRGYAADICQAVTYNTAAAAGNANYGDPWQLVYVFDNDSSTNVVCEGYSKAFKYLCDISSFNSDKIKCYLVTGTLGSGTGAGAHMWNVVTMENGKSYLADITNSDDRTGEPEVLLLRGGISSDGAYSSTYTFDDFYEFTYDDDTKSLWGEDLLTLDTTDYKNCIIASDGTTITGDQSGKVVYVLDGAAVTLNNATITAPDYTSAIVCIGNATITVEGTCSVTGGTSFEQNGTVKLSGGSGIQAAGSNSDRKKLVIDGSGTLNAKGGRQAAAIGSRYCEAFGEIYIQGDVTIDAVGGIRAAGIGTGRNQSDTNHKSIISGKVTVGGNAVVTATGGSSGSGIGCGYNGYIKDIEFKGGTVRSVSVSSAKPGISVNDPTNNNDSVSFYTTITSGGIIATNNSDTVSDSYVPISANSTYFLNGTTNSAESFSDVTSSDGKTRTIKSKVSVVQHDINFTAKGSANTTLNVDKIQQGDTVLLTVTVPTSDSIISVVVQDDSGFIDYSIPTNGEYTKTYQFKAGTSDISIEIVTGKYVPASSSCSDPGNYYIGSDGNYWIYNGGFMEIEWSDLDTTHHSFNNPAWVWDGFNSATATFTCEKCGETTQRTANITSETTDTGIKYTAAINFSNDPEYTNFTSTSYSDVKTVYNPIVKFASLTMKGEIGLNFYVELDKSLVASGYYDDAYVLLSGPKGDTKLMVTDAEYDSDTEAYKFTYRVPAKNIYDAITFSFYMDGDTKMQLNGKSGSDIYARNAYEFSYAVTDYIAIAHNTYTDGSQDDLLAMLDSLKTYGTYARKLFSYKVDEIDNSELADVSDVTKETLSDHIASQEGTPSGVTVKSFSLVMESETSIKLYVDVTDGGTHTFKVNGKDAQLKTDDNGKTHYLVLSDIPASKLSTKYTFQIDGYTLTCSALSYAYSAMKNSTNDDLHNSVAALYKYSNAANTYFSSN